MPAIAARKDSTGSMAAIQSEAFCAFCVVARNRKKKCWWSRTSPPCRDPTIAWGCCRAVSGRNCSIAMHQSTVAADMATLAAASPCRFPATDICGRST